jgi:hypothetical protein
MGMRWFRHVEDISTVIAQESRDSHRSREKESSWKGWSHKVDGVVGSNQRARQAVRGWNGSSEGLQASLEWFPVHETRIEMGTKERDDGKRKSGGPICQELVAVRGTVLKEASVSPSYVLQGGVK